MNVRQILLMAILTTLMFSCDPEKQQDESVSGDTLEITKLKSNFMLDNNLLNSFDQSIERDNLMNLDNEIPTSRDDLEKMRTVFKMYNGRENAGISIPGFMGLKLGKNESSMSVYYIESKVVTTPTDSIIYGCGYSVHYLFKKVKKGISIENLPSVAASSQLSSNKTQVYYSLQTYGIKGDNLIRYFKPTVNKNFNVEGFGIMQSSIDGIHNILGDTKLSSAVKFIPEILKFVQPYELEQI